MMANRWWSGQPGGLPGPESGSFLGPDLGISTTPRGGADEEEERENHDDPKEGAIDMGTRRPRGRPTGSKNKPKAPIYITRDSPNALRSLVMEAANGSDIAESIAQFARKRQRGVCVLSANGAISNVTLKQPSGQGSVMPLQGRFEILSLSGSFLPGPAPPGSTGLTIYLAGGQGQVVGGIVVGSLVAAGPVMIIAATFSNAAYERLPLEEEEEAGGGGGGGGSPPNGNGERGQQQIGSSDASNSMPQVFDLPQNLVNNSNMGQMNHDAFAWNNGNPSY